MRSDQVAPIQDTKTIIKRAYSLQQCIALANLKTNTILYHYVNKNFLVRLGFTTYFDSCT